MLTTAIDYKYSFGNLLFFLYHIIPGNFSQSLDYLSSSSLNLNGGDIKDKSGNEAVLTLPEPGSANSLSGQTKITINAKAKK